VGGAGSPSEPRLGKALSVGGRKWTVCIERPVSVASLRAVVAAPVVPRQLKIFGKKHRWSKPVGFRMLRNL